MNPIEIEALIDKQVKQLKEEKKYIGKLKRKLNSNNISDDERDTIKEYLKEITDLQHINFMYETAVRLGLESNNEKFRQTIGKLYGRRAKALNNCDKLRDRLRDFS